MRSTLLPPLLLSILLTVGTDVTAEEEDRKPNFVLIMVDDLGIGDVGCYGNDTIRTPNVDKLASEGVKLTQHIAASPLCTPSRAAFMTGRYAIRSGKWHLGVNCEHRGDHCHHPNHHGFSFFYGMPFSLFSDCIPGNGSDILFSLQQMLQNFSLLLGLGLITLVFVRVCGLLHISLWLLVPLSFLSISVTALWIVPFKFLPTWNCIIMRNQEVIEQPMTAETLPQRMLEEAQNFIKRNADRPFLLFFSLVHIHTPLFKNPAFAGRSQHGVYGDNVEEMDSMIGQITETVDSLGLTTNTLMYFASDHGGYIEDNQKGGWNGIYKGGKAMGGWEGGIRVPGIFRWPGKLPAGRVVDEPTSLMDLYPTLKYLAKDTQPDRPLDGYNLMPLLEGKLERSEHEFMFHYCGVYLNAVRWHPPGSNSIFKVHFFTPNFFPPGTGACHNLGICLCHDHVTHHNPPLVFDLFYDPSESHQLSPDTEPRFDEILKQTAEAVERHQSTFPNTGVPDGTGSHTSTHGVPNQLTWQEIVWKPWLQPCCGTFPFCGCKEEKKSHT
ncbi:arylsulfatase D isoform X2 [Thalassophryne amazonica]|uniref:arylsulfatase D isoform X2 n=1 Tax=Thalassophryne amazonica TaxID=390379 RepID=UPI0014718BFC|nr:arylsulfatase D isoform X2 [Thalassophryne amazonica]